MTVTIENPKITISQLDAIEKAVRKNSAEAADYQLIDNYFSFLGSSYRILNNLREEGISGYDEFIHQRQDFPHGDINYLIGSVLGIISILKRHLFGKL